MTQKKRVRSLSLEKILAIKQDRFDTLNVILSGINTGLRFNSYLSLADEHRFVRVGLYAYWKDVKDYKKDYGTRIYHRKK